MTIRLPRVSRSLISTGAILVSLTGATGVRGESRVTTQPVPDDGRPVAAESDPQGAIHLLFDADDGPRYAKSIDDGATFSQAIPVVDRDSRKPGLEFHAWDMAVGPEGHVHVALGTNAWKLKLPQEAWAYYYARLDPEAAAFAPVQNINRKPSEGFSLAAGDKGRVTACWLSGKLYANISRDNGATFAPAVEIDAALDPCDCCTTSADYAPDGRLALLYREETHNQRDMFLVLWDQERNKVSRTQVSSTLWNIEACPMTYYSVSRAGDGLVAVWPTRGQLYFARLDGKDPLQPPAEIKVPGTSGMRTGMLTLTATDGSTLVAWKKDGQLNWQLYDRRGRESGLPGSARSAGNGVAGALASDGRFVLFR